MSKISPDPSDPGLQLPPVKVPAKLENEVRAKDIHGADNALEAFANPGEHVAQSNLLTPLIDVENPNNPREFKRTATKPADWSANARLLQGDQNLLTVSAAHDEEDEAFSAAFQPKSWYTNRLDRLTTLGGAQGPGGRGPGGSKLFQARATRFQTRGGFKPGVTVTALFSRHHDSPEQLSFNQGDEITILAHDPSGYYIGELDGESGLVPPNFVGSELSKKTSDPLSSKNRWKRLGKQATHSTPFHEILAKARQESANSPLEEEDTHGALGEVVKMMKDQELAREIMLGEVDTEEVQERTDAVKEDRKEQLRSALANTRKGAGKDEIEAALRGYEEQFDELKAIMEMERNEQDEDIKRRHEEKRKKKELEMQRKLEEDLAAEAKNEKERKKILHDHQSAVKELYKAVNLERSAQYAELEARLAEKRRRKEQTFEEEMVCEALKEDIAERESGYVQTDEGESVDCGEWILQVMELRSRFNSKEGSFQTALRRARAEKREEVQRRELMKRYKARMARVDMKARKKRQVEIDVKGGFGPFEPATRELHEYTPQDVSGIGGQTWFSKGEEEDEVEVVDPIDRKLPTSYKLAITRLKNVLKARPKYIELGKDGDRHTAAQQRKAVDCCEWLVAQIVDIYYDVTLLDSHDILDTVATDTMAFEWLRDVVFAPYFDDLKDKVTDDAKIDDPMGLQMISLNDPDPAHPEAWVSVLEPDVSDAKKVRAFKILRDIRKDKLRLVLERYPFMSYVCEEIARYLAAANNPTEAVLFSSHNVHIASVITPHLYSKQIAGWNQTKIYFLQQRKSKTLYRDFISRELALRKLMLGYEHMVPPKDTWFVGRTLLQVMLRDKKRAMSNTIEKIGTYTMTYGAYIATLGCIVLCILFSWCSAPEQVGYSPNFEYNINLPIVLNVENPGEDIGGTPCLQSAECTCSEWTPSSCDASNSCEEINCVGSLWCDADNVCGDLRYSFRHYLPIIYFSNTILEFFLLGLASMIVAWPPVPVEHDRDRVGFVEKRARDLRHVALMIPSHGPPKAIKETLRAALQVFKPEQIYICHNGRTTFPIDGGQTRQWCEDFCRNAGFSTVPVYTWTAEPNKTMSLYMTLKNKVDVNHQYMMIIDNDVLLPEDLYVPIGEFKNKKVKAMAFTIRAENLTTAKGKINYLTNFQDVEYKKSGLMKMLQAKLGSAFYAHGAIALWEKNVLIDVFDNHNTMFDGEDLQMGYIMHMFNKDYRMKCVGNISVPTSAPNHFICSGLLNCRHSEKSLFQQRVKSWDKAAHRVVLLYFQMLFLSWGRGVLALKLFLIYEIWAVFQDYVRWPLFLWVLVDGGLDVSSDWTPMEDSFLSALFWITIAQEILMLIQNYWIFRNREDLRSPIQIVLTFPLYNLLLLFLRFGGLIYNMLFYLPQERKLPRVKDRNSVPLVFEYRECPENHDQSTWPFYFPATNGVSEDDIVISSPSKATKKEV